MDCGDGYTPLSPDQSFHSPEMKSRRSVAARRQSFMVPALDEHDGDSASSSESTDSDDPAVDTDVGEYDRASTKRRNVTSFAGDLPRSSTSDAMGTIGALRTVLVDRERTTGRGLSDASFALGAQDGATRENASKLSEDAYFTLLLLHFVYFFLIFAVYCQCILMK